MLCLLPPHNNNYPLPIKSLNVVVFPGFCQYSFVTHFLSDTYFLDIIIMRLQIIVLASFCLWSKYEVSVVIYNPLQRIDSTSFEWLLYWNDYWTCVFLVPVFLPFYFSVFSPIKATNCLTVQPIRSENTLFERGFCVKLLSN